MSKEVSLRSAKNEILDAYNELLAKSKEQKIADRKVEKKKEDGEPEISLSLHELKKSFNTTIRKQEEYIQKCKRLENTVCLLQGFIETIAKDEYFKQLITAEGITIPFGYFTDHNPQSLIADGTEKDFHATASDGLKASASG